MASTDIEMINHDAGIFIDANGFSYPVVMYLDAGGSECSKDEGDYAIAGVEGRWFTLDLSDFNLSRGDVFQ
jgi:hypothetical protein